MTVKQLVPGTLCNIVEIVPTGGKAPDVIWGRRYTSITGPGQRQINKIDGKYIDRTDIIMFISQWNETHAEVFVRGKCYIVLSGYLAPLCS